MLKYLEREGINVTDYESWMPDFMEGLSKGIEKSKHLVTSSIKNLATDVNVGMKLNQSIPEMSGSKSKKDSTLSVINNFNGNYSFRNEKDIDYFMNQAGLKLKGVR